VEREWPVQEPHDGNHAPLRAERIRSCVGQAGFRGREVVTALDSPAVEFHSLDLPETVVAGDHGDTPQVVRWEVERLANQRGEGMETRHWPLPATDVQAPNVIAVSADYRTVSRTLKICDDAGLLCTGIDVGAAALARLGALLSARSPDEVWGVLDVGHAESRLVLCVDHVPVVVRQAGSGGSTWTQRIAKSLQLSTKAAEVQKREHGIALAGRGVRRESVDLSGQEIAAILLAALRSELKELASEIKRSYEFARSCYPRCRVGDLVVVGGGAAMHNLPEFLSAALGIPVKRASDCLDDDGCRLRCDTAEQRKRLNVVAQAIGLALGD
jgi:Tfp pilus assembly PilM family ATPase